MKRARTGLFVTSNLGKLWAIGGRDIYPRLSCVEEYDPALDSWSDAKTPMKSIAGEVCGCKFQSEYFHNM